MYENMQKKVTFRCHNDPIFLDPLLLIISRWFLFFFFAILVCMDIILGTVKQMKPREAADVYFTA